jgi:SAM-dependent methyltransferase
VRSVSHQIDRASPWIARFANLVPEGEVLDLACGHGRHARLFAAAGHPVLAVDRDSEALAGVQGERIATLQADLEDGSPWPFAAARFSGIVVTNYLHRPLFRGILDSLCAGGVLLMETFAVGNGQFGKPSNPDFLLAPGELLDMARTAGDRAMHVIAYEDGYVALPKPALVQRICLAKPPFAGETPRFALI